MIFVSITMFSSTRNTIKHLKCHLNEPNWWYFENGLINVSYAKLIQYSYSENYFTVGEGGFYLVILIITL